MVLLKKKSPSFRPDPDVCSFFSPYDNQPYTKAFTSTRSGCVFLLFTILVHTIINLVPKHSRVAMSTILHYITSTVKKALYCNYARSFELRLHTRSMGSFPALVNITHIQELVYKAVSSLHWYYVNTAGSEENEIGTSLCVVGDCCGFHRYLSRGYWQSKWCRWWKERSRCPRQWWWGERTRRWWRTERSRWQPPLPRMLSLPSPQAPPPLSSFMPPLLGQYMHVHVRGSPFQCVLLSPQTGLWTHLWNCLTIEDIAINFTSLLTC